MTADVLAGCLPDVRSEPVRRGGCHSPCCPPAEGGSGLGGWTAVCLLLLPVVASNAAQFPGTPSSKALRANGGLCWKAVPGTRRGD